MTTYRLATLCIAALLLTGCATTRPDEDLPRVACEEIEPKQCVDRHRGALELCRRYHVQAQRRAEQRSREAELYQWIAAGSTATAAVLGATLIGFAATPADL